LADAGKELLFQALADQTKKASVIITYESAPLKCSSTFHGLPLFKFRDWASHHMAESQAGLQFVLDRSGRFPFHPHDSAWNITALVTLSGWLLTKVAMRSYRTLR
jgi:hypothetical protein